MRRFHRNTRYDGILAILPNPLTRLDPADLLRPTAPVRPPTTPAPAPNLVPAATRPAPGR